MHIVKWGKMCNLSVNRIPRMEENVKHKKILLFILRFYLNAFFLFFSFLFLFPTFDSVLFKWFKWGEKNVKKTQIEHKMKLYVVSGWT